MSAVVCVLLSNQYQTLTVSASPSSAYSGRTGGGNCTTNPITALPVGAQPGYTYSWAKVSGDTFTINSPTSATTTFTVTVGLSDSKQAVYRCTVTSADGQVASTDVTVTALELSFNFY